MGRFSATDFSVCCAARAREHASPMPVVEVVHLDDFSPTVDDFSPTLAVLSRVQVPAIVAVDLAVEPAADSSEELLDGAGAPSKAPKRKTTPAADNR